MPVFKAQTISRPQMGEGAYGANTKIRNLKLKQARIDRLKQLDSVGLGDILEARNIKRKIGATPALLEAEINELEQWCATAEVNKKKKWTDWVQEQLAKGGGKLYKWAQRAEAQEGLATLEAGPQGQEVSIAARLQQARAAWSKFWKRGQDLATNLRRSSAGNNGGAGQVCD